MPREIEEILSKIDGKGYSRYKSLVGASQVISGVNVRIVRVQGDPFAPPSVVKLSYTFKRPGWLRPSPLPIADYILRRFREGLSRASRKLGEGNSGLLSTINPGPIVIPRSALEARIRGGYVEITARVWVGLPSRGRRILGRQAMEILEACASQLRRTIESINPNEIDERVKLWLDQQHLRRALEDLGLVAFIADGSILPRRCGKCWEPLAGAVPFESPNSLRVEIELPFRGVVSGMGVRAGVTAITGPAFHGKTTLLEAIASGVWDHVMGDGRELVVTRRDAFFAVSENGRSVSCVDISPFVASLPSGSDTKCFTTDDASGATSLAASIQEAVESGSKVILIDEDTAATNILHRDEWAERVTGKRSIVPLTELSRGMKEKGISIVIVASGALPLLASADTIIVMDEYRAVDASWYSGEARRKLAIIHGGAVDYWPPYGEPARRRVSRPVKTRRYKLRGYVLEVDGSTRIDLSGMVQVEEEYQRSTAVRMALMVLSRPGPLAESASRISERLYRWDYSFLPGEPGPDISYVRPQEILYVVNRVPGIPVSRAG